MSNGSRRVVFIPLILLIILVVLFYNELIALGLRMYVAVTDNPRAEILLGKYYQNSGFYNLNYANRFYERAHDQLKGSMENGTVQEKIWVGRLYQCGRGVSRDTTEAKRWYDAASKDATPEQKAEIQRHITNLNDSTTSKTTNAKTNSGDNGQGVMQYPGCTDYNDNRFFKGFWK